jgi:hypothetical protein
VCTLVEFGSTPNFVGQQLAISSQKGVTWILNSETTLEYCILSKQLVSEVINTTLEYTSEEKEKFRRVFFFVPDENGQFKDHL